MIEYWKVNFGTTYTTINQSVFLSGESRIEHDPEHMRLAGVFNARETTDRKYRLLRSELNVFVKFFFEAKFVVFNEGFGPTIGYFNSKTLHLEDSAFVAVVGKAIGLAYGNSKGEVSIEWSEPVIEPNKLYSIRVEYLPGEAITISGETGITAEEISGESGVTSEIITSETEEGVTGELPSNCYGTLVLYIYDEYDNLLDMTSKFVCDTFFPDSFGVGNIDLYNNVDAFFTYPYDPALNVFTVTAFINYLRYFDPTIEFPIREVESLVATQYQAPFAKNGEDYVQHFNALDFVEDDFWPEYGWAENTWVSSRILERNFGKLAHFLVSKRCQTDYNYLTIIDSLFRSGWGGATLRSIERGIKALFGLPVLDVQGTVTSILTSEGKYHVTVSTSLGDQVFTFAEYLGLSKYMGEEIAVGITLPAGTPISGGVDIVDYLKEPDWNINLYCGELDKYFTFGVKLKPMAIPWERLAPVMTVFLRAIKPAGMHGVIYRDTGYPLFMIGEYSHLDYVNIPIIANWPSHIPADYVFLESDSDLYYQCPELVSIEATEVIQYSPSITKKILIMETTSDLSADYSSGFGRYHTFFPSVWATENSKVNPAFSLDMIIDTDDVGVSERILAGGLLINDDLYVGVATKCKDADTDEDIQNFEIFKVSQRSIISTGYEYKSDVNSSWVFAPDQGKACITDGKTTIWSVPPIEEKSYELDGATWMQSNQTFGIFKADGYAYRVAVLDGYPTKCSGYYHLNTTSSDKIKSIYYNPTDDYLDPEDFSKWDLPITDTCYFITYHKEKFYSLVQQSNGYALYSFGIEEVPELLNVFTGRIHNVMVCDDYALAIEASKHGVWKIYISTGDFTSWKGPYAGGECLIPPPAGSLQRFKPRYALVGDEDNAYIIEVGQKIGELRYTIRVTGLRIG